MTVAGDRLKWMLKTDPMPPNWRPWPRSFDARLTERIVQDFVPRIESEARNAAIDDAVASLVDGGWWEEQLPTGETVRAVRHDTVLGLLDELRARP